MPDIFHSPIVPASQDAFWAPLPANVSAMQPKDTLVLSTVFAPGSAEENQLHKMLGACKITPADYNVVQFQTTQQLPWHQLKELLKPTKVLLLGLMPAQLGISALFIPHEVNRFNEVVWMPTFGLDNLLTNTALKQHLWANVFQKVYFQ